MKYRFLVLCWFASIIAHAQSKPRIKSLKIGDQMPDLTLTITRNDQNKVVRLSQLRGKMIILDFWGTNCVGCLQAMPKMGRLQQQFNQQLQIILVNAQTQKGIDSQFEKFPNNALQFDKAKLPSVNGDKMLHQLFPHEIIPHEVWIDSKGKVMAITDDDEVTAANIERVLHHTAYPLRRKQELAEFDFKKAFLPQLYDSMRQVALYYSTLIRHTPGLWGGNLRMVVDSAQNTIRITRGSISILELYGDALSQFAYGGNPCEIPELDYGKRVILEVSDSNRYFYQPRQDFSWKEWEAENKYCYELVLPLADRDKMYPYMLQDLNRYFNMEGYNARKILKCLAIVRTSNAIKFAADDTRQPVQFTNEDSVFYTNGLFMNAFRNELSKNNQHSPYAFVDETGYKGKIQLKISAHLRDLVALKKELQEKYDLDLVEKEVELDVMVIKENKKDTLSKK